ncbi:unannotated protein [freshwater metagenome]|uniref:Unannotated protein n=1 Tax=freshwater metagenome TaxID=449393 RepID=A0A6J5ZW87_9ZZZZ|nr:hypothetical protein [Actinomycetota bacterium]
MRLIAWNANYNNQRRSFEADLALLAPLNGDVIVLSETSRPKVEASGKVMWIGGEGPGLAVAALNGYSIEPSESNVEAPKLSGGFTVDGPLRFNLLAVWPVKTQGDSYARILDACLDCHAGLLRTDRVVLAGDLNSSTRVINQAESHPRFVARATALGLASVYHHQSGERHGDETKATYRHGKKTPRPFCIDYCFVSTPWLNSASLEILDGPEWEGRSDHYPLVLELPDGL